MVISELVLISIFELRKRLGPTDTPQWVFPQITGGREYLTRVTRIGKHSIRE